jgi:hypothetical protein
LATQDVEPVLVMTMEPVIVPAAPWDCPGAPFMELHATGPTEVDVAVVEVVDGEVVVDVVPEEWCRTGADVVETVLLAGVLLHAAAHTATPARTASAQRRFTPRSPPA